MGEAERAAVRQFFAELKHPVKLVVFTEGSVQLPGSRPCPYCQETVQLVREVAELSDKISVEIVNFHVEKDKAEEYGITRIPAIALVGAKDYGVRYYGIPAGYEFRAFIEDIVDVANGTTDLSPETLEQLARLDAPVHIQVFVTPTCPYCPPMVRLAHKLAIASDFVRADMVEAQEFPDLARRYGVFGVPRTVVNEDTHMEGAMPEPYAMLYVLKAAGKLTAEEARTLESVAR